LTRILPAVVACALLAWSPWPAWAVNPDEQLRDPALEARAYALSKDLRCVVCQNQSIDDSDAALARDLRIILRERIAAGDTDAQAVDFLVQRYGSFVQLRPPLRLDTLVLWFGPLALLVAGGTGAVFYMRGRRSAVATALSAEDDAEAARLLETDEAR
jgi:cytochrome c-type biogenesis protein CcmH